MPDITSFKEVNEILSTYVPAARKYREAVVSLDRIKQLMHMLGDPQDTYKVVHVAGTSGKTSTAYYVAAFLAASGKKVGLTVSPHINEVNERVQINGRPLSESKFCNELEIFLNRIRALNLKPTYFELLIAFAYWEFARQKVDYAVIEVGLGGLLDASNVITRRDKVCIITDIGHDHTEILGKTLGEIAAQKAGIIKPYNTVFCYEQGDEVMDVLRDVAEQLQAELHEIWSIKSADLPTNLPLYQRRNWYLAYNAFRYIAERDQLPELDENLIAKTTHTYIPGRMEIMKYGGKTLIFDGAHNPQKMQALVQSMKRRYPKQDIAVLFSLIQSKKSRTIGTLKQITSLAHELVITTFINQQDARKVSVAPLKLADYCESLDFHNWQIIDDPKKALAKFLKRPEPILLITGSFYLISLIKPFLPKSTK